MRAITRRRSALAALLAGSALWLAACGHDHYYRDYDGNVFVNNETHTTTMEDVLAFRVAPFGEPFTGNLLPAPLPPAATRYVGRFQRDYYDAEADLSGGDLVEWFDVWVGDGQDVFFDVF
jgi:hypothetical protein